MDFDDADGSGKPPPKAPRFVPKSRFQPKSRSNPAAPPPAAPPGQPKAEPSNDGAPPPVSVKKEVHEPIDDSGMSLSTANENGAKSEIPDGDGDGDSMDVDARIVATGEEEEEERNNEEEEDFVVREIDVYFNPPPLDEGTKLFVLQYPLRPSWRPYELDEKHTEIRVKPISTDVEIDLPPVEKKSENYDGDALSDPRFDKLTLSSKWRSTPRTAYAIGVFTGSELHLNPVHAVRQLRPSMEYLNPNASKTKNVSAVATNATSSRAESSGNQNKAMDLKDDEPSITLKCHLSDSVLSAAYRRKMLAKVNSSVEFPMKPLEYLDSLCPQASIDRMKPVAPSKRSLLLLPLDQRLRLLFTEGPPLHRFSALKHFAPDHPDVDVLLRALEQVALPVQGNWVVKTAIRYSDCKPPFGLARDYVLLLFTQSTTIKFSDLAGTKIPKPVWDEVLCELAIARPKCEDWKFREPTDMIFIKQYPKIIEESEIKWKAKEEELRERVRPKKNPSKAIASGKLNQSRISDRSAVKSVSGMRIETKTMSSETREAIPRALRKLFQANKVRSLQSISQGLQSMAISNDKIGKGGNVAKVAALGLVDAPQEELLEFISEVAVEIHGTFVLKSSSEHPELDPLRNVVIDLFRANEPDAKLKKSDITVAAKIKLQKAPNNDEFRKVVSEFCESSGNAWVLKKGDGPSTSSAK